MRLTCRSCGATGSAEQVFGDADAAATLLLAGELQPAVARLVWPYLALFRSRTRALSWSRTHKLLAELVDLIQRPTITRKHREFVATAPMWQQALEHMAAIRDSLTLPMEGHGYLLDVVSGLAEKASAQAERDHEQGLRSVVRTAAAEVHAHSPSAVVYNDHQRLYSEREARKRLKLPAMTTTEEEYFLAAERTRIRDTKPANTGGRR